MLGNRRRCGQLYVGRFPFTFNPSSTSQRLSCAASNAVIGGERGICEETRSAQLNAVRKSGRILNLEGTILRCRATGVNGSRETGTVIT